MSAARPLDPGASRLWTIPAGVGFIRALASTLADVSGLRDDPAALSTAEIYVPNARSASALADALFDACGRDGFLSPDIRPLGDIAGEPPSTRLMGLGLEIDPPVAPAERLGVFMRLVMKWHEAEHRPVSATSALAAAEELAAICDQAVLAGIEDLDGLDTLVEDSTLAAHWDVSLDFLSILRQAWPEYLAVSGRSEVLAARRAAAEALAQHWRTRPPAGPVIIAGSTGTNPTSRVLMRAALALEQGLVVLPGLDTGLGPQETETVATTPSHPQHALVTTLADLGSPLTDVAIWPGTEDIHRPARARLVSAALAPAGATADWIDKLDQIAAPQHPEAFAATATDGLTVIETATEADEARAAALLMREGLETGEGHIALVTPDATLARRVSAELRRWGLDIAPSAGTPLQRTPSGALLARLARWLVDPAEPVALLGLLRSGKMALGFSAAELDNACIALEMGALRGPRKWQDLHGLRGRLEKAPTGQELIDRVLEAIETHFGDFVTAPIPDVCARLARLAEALTSGPGGRALIWTGPDGQAAAKALIELSDIGAHCPEVAPLDFCELIERMLAGRTMVEPGARHPRLSIWGPLEARLQSADRVILAGLNEGTWPELPGGDMFLPRHFRTELGLPDPEDRVGLSAHDFSQLACGREVYLLRAGRVDNQPSVPSRWLWRLRAIVSGAVGVDHAADLLEGARAAQVHDWLEALHTPTPTSSTPATTAKPTPKPPLSHRPKRLSVTQIETLIRDPYAIYARHVLGIKAEPPVGQKLQAAERGTAVHDALKRFTNLGSGIEKSRETLLSLLEEELRRNGQTDAESRLERAFWKQAVDGFFDWLDSRDQVPDDVRAEIDGKLEFEVGGEPFTLSARADRIEEYPDGIEIFDFKTGSGASAKQVDSGLASQLPLMGAMALRGGFKDLSADHLRALRYIAFRARYEVKDAGDTKASEPPEKAEAAFAGLLQLLARYLDEGRAYPSKPCAEFTTDWGDYDRLARRAEWADAGAGDGGGSE